MWWRTPASNERKISCKATSAGTQSNNNKIKCHFGMSAYFIQFFRCSHIFRILSWIRLFIYMFQPFGLFTQPSRLRFHTVRWVFGAWSHETQSKNNAADWGACIKLDHYFSDIFIEENIPFFFGGLIWHSQLSFRQFRLSTNPRIQKGSTIKNESALQSSYGKFVWRISTPFLIPHKSLFRTA